MITAWDIKRAFDSIPHPFIRLMLQQLGISDATADWFLYFLQHNIVTVKSPLVQAQETHTFAAYPVEFTDSLHTSHLAASFHQKRGIGQGDTPSVIFWVVLYDVFFCMLNVPPTALWLRRRYSQCQNGVD